MKRPRLRPVDQARALRLAIKALSGVRSRLAFDAHLYERGLPGYQLPGFEWAWREYTLAGQAIERLERML